MKTNKIQFCLFALLMLFPFSLNAQNLVPNPSFESYSQCPTGPLNMYDCNDWYNASPVYSADYYNACYNEPVGYPTDVPLNLMGYQEALTGNAYSGVDARVHRSYIQAELTEPLVAGQCYYLEMFTSPAKRIDTIGPGIQHHTFICF